MTRWNARTLDAQTAYVAKTYANAPIRVGDGLRVQTGHDIEHAASQFELWLDAVKAEAAATALEEAAERYPKSPTTTFGGIVIDLNYPAVEWLRKRAAAIRSGVTR